jgi:hypothetical protein
MSDSRKKATKTQLALGVAPRRFPSERTCTNLMTKTTACESGKAGEQSVVAAAHRRMSKRTPSGAGYDID